MHTLRGAAGNQTAPWARNMPAGCPQWAWATRLPEICIIDTLLDGLGMLSKHQKKFPNFDSDRFAAAFAACLGKPTQ